MPFPFALPTTSSVLLSDFFQSVTHPSLPLQATTKRSVVKDALKKHKRLSPQMQISNLPSLQDALKSYLPYLLALNAGSSYRAMGQDNIDVEVLRPLAVEWRTTLTAGVPGREPSRQKLTGMHHEIAFTITTLAYVSFLLARCQLRVLYESNVLSSEQRTLAISIAMKHLQEAYVIQSYLLSLPSIAAAKDAPIDIQPSTISALASLARAEATLVVVSKDDPYLAAVADDRNENNKEWMYKAPSIPAVRAHLFARMCLAAAEHAGSAYGLLARSGSGRVDDDLAKFAGDLRRTARARAARFLAIDAELNGKTGEGLGWLKGSRKELGLSVELDEGKRKGFGGLKQSWKERREDRKVEKGGEWGMDAGRLEEARVVEMLVTKWERENSTINIQAVPAHEPLLASMPSGREYPLPEPWSPPTLDASTLIEMRAPPEPDEVAFRGDEQESDDDDVAGLGGIDVGNAPGAFPGATYDGGRSATATSYY
ncbi:hypothetical protein K431DRAFT_281433 [Polychaeton citri CBS 116435]|uniref:pH-response regulator protein palC n=1 Tax=Polychaeton citri CBS 116435 TaxID=1314669 RepID=A0A9P4QFN4_9PEZI|nr:hypothetical protein K431DRAFT_281433 [Polychaeton citri CBS 116435]